MSKQIQWFPGHMSKTLKEFKEIKTDLYFILLDSRAPESTFIDSFNEIILNKKVIVLLTKSDLVNKEELNKYISIYKYKYIDCFSISLNDSNKVRKEIKKILNNIKFKSFLPKIVILGAPNVGKSTLINILTNSKKTKAEDKVGVTKKKDWFQWENKYWILDTPGVLQPKFINSKQGENLAAIGSIKLDILPLYEIAFALITKLINKNVINANNANEYISNRININKKSEEIIYKNIIKDYQKGKFGKEIID